MESTSFYVTLPSNASMNIYPKNTQASFQIRLPRTLYLKHSYEVALAEIQYPITWRTFALDDSYMISINDQREDLQYRALFFPRGYYNSISELIKTINETLLTFFHIEGDRGDEVVLTEHPIEQKIQIEVKDGIYVQFHGECCDALGFDCDEWYHGMMYSPHRYDISRGFHALYVYCNICEPQIVGDVYAPLLRSIAIKGNRGEHVIKTYAEPHYIPVTDRQVDNIEINIKDDTGVDVPFMRGKVVCKLHFRQRTL